ncbi:kinase-like domain-containing protein [Rhizophagus irregularis DAOM 181602=DAOM 197198]|nr:kinase-like domain-containing protein [Rhizophagus irregularis DAOM 181602=DAOM 197198]
MLNSSLNRQFFFFEEGYYSKSSKKNKSWKLRNYVICWKEACVHKVIQHTHAWPLLGTRKLDFVFIQRDSTLDPLNVVVVGEIKMRIGEGFSNTQAISFVYRKDRSTNYSEKITKYTYEHVKSECFGLFLYNFFSCPCDTEPFDAKVDKYTKGLEKIANNQQGERTERAQLLLICFKKGPDLNGVGNITSKVPGLGLGLEGQQEAYFQGDFQYKMCTKKKEIDQRAKNSGAPVDFKLIINNICIRSTMERWRKSTKYIDEIHKQDLMRYNIIDTNSSSGTKARELFKYQWDNIISTIEKFLMSEPNKIMLASDSDSISLADQDGRAEDVRQYLTKISKNVNTVKGLCDAIKTECEKLRKEGNIRWKKLSLELMKYTGNSSQIVEISSKEEQTEYDYIIRYVSRVYIMLIKDKPLLKCYWGEKTLRCSAILLNRSLKDDNRRCSGNKIDAIMSILDIGLEFSTLEVSGSPSKPDHIHYEDKVYGVQIYDHNLYVYKLPIFASNLWMLRDLITSSFNSILTYITSDPLQIDNDNTMIANAEASPPQKKNCSNN